MIASRSVQCPGVWFAQEPGLVASRLVSTVNVGGEVASAPGSHKLSIGRTKTSAAHGRNLLCMRNRRLTALLRRWRDLAQERKRATNQSASPSLPLQVALLAEHVKRAYSIPDSSTKPTPLVPFVLIEDFRKVRDALQGIFSPPAKLCVEASFYGSRRAPLFSSRAVT